MNFEEKIRATADKIYEVVVKFVNENKGDDDLYYNYAFIKLNNGKEIRYNFEDGTIELPFYEECEYNFIMATEITIDNKNTRIDLENEDEPRDQYKYISYDTSLKEKIASADKERKKLNYMKKLLKQINLSKEVKSEIKQRYTRLYRALPNMTYNKEKTHNTENFNTDVYELYDHYMHQKELTNLEKSQETILPSVKKAVEWWANKIVITDEQDIFIRIRSENEEPLEPITVEQLAKFKDALAERIMKEIDESDGELVKVGVYDSPMIILYDAIKEANINERRVPKHPLTMYIRTYWIEVEEYFESSEIYNSTTEEDIEKIKQIHLNQISNGTSYVLKNN